MKKKQCPICFGELEVIDVAPCDDCGHDQNEINHFYECKHTYREFEIFGVTLILCDFCMVDFSSYDPEYFGLSKNKIIGLGSQKLKEIQLLNNLSIQKDKFCPTCGHRLSFLKWLKDVNEENGS